MERNRPSREEIARRANTPKPDGSYWEDVEAGEMDKEAYDLWWKTNKELHHKENTNKLHGVWWHGKYYHNGVAQGYWSERREPANPDMLWGVASGETNEIPPEAVTTPEAETVFNLYTPNTIDNAYTRELVQELDAKVDEHPDAQIRLFIDTYGGGLDAALELTEYFRHIGNPLITVARSKCYSAGVLLLSAGQVRLCYPETRFLIHRTQINNFSYSGPIVGMAESLRSLYSIDRKFIQMIGENIGADWRDIYRKAKCDWRFGVDTALNMGLVTGVLPTYDERRKGKL